MTPVVVHVVGVDVVGVFVLEGDALVGDACGGSESWSCSQGHGRVVAGRSDPGCE